MCFKIMVFAAVTAVAGVVCADMSARPLSVFDFMDAAQIANIQKGMSEDDTAQIQAAFDVLHTDASKSLCFPAGTYKVSRTLSTAGVLAGRIWGAAGFDGAESVLNGGVRTVIKWIGPESPDAAVVRHTRANGMVWSGISIDCNHRAGYGIQFDSDIQTAGAIRNVIELCSINYARRDGIIIGSEGAPAANHADRQFFAYTVRQVVLRGCRRSGIHVNEWNADLHVYDQVWGFPDDTMTWDCANVFWFERGGNASELRSCESSATAATAEEGSGFMIKNGSSEPHTGCQGLTIINAWSEEDGGFFWANTMGVIKNPYTFINCKAYGKGAKTDGLSVYVALKGAKPAAFSFHGCHFNADVKFDTPLITSSLVTDIGCYWGDGAGIVGVDGAKTIGRIADLGAVPPGNQALALPRFAQVVKMTLAANLTALRADGMDDGAAPLTLIVRQDALGGRTISFDPEHWAEGIPPPNPAPHALTIYVFVRDGKQWRLLSVSGPSGA